MLGNPRKTKRTKLRRNSKKIRRARSKSKSINLLGGSEAKKKIIRNLRIIRNKYVLVLTTLLLIVIEYFLIVTIIRTQIYDLFTIQFSVLFVYFIINFRNKKYFLIFYLCLIPFFLVLFTRREIVLEQDVDLKYTFWVDYEDIPGDDELSKMKEEDIELLVPINSIKKNLGYYKGDNESFSYEVIGETNATWIDSKTINGNCEIKIVEDWYRHGNLLEIADGGLEDYCNITHYYNRDLINESLDFYFGVEWGGGVHLNLLSSSIGWVTTLGISPYNIWGNINNTTSGVLFDVDSINKLTRFKIKLNNKTLELYANDIYYGECNYSCLYFDETIIPHVDQLSFSTNNYQQGLYYLDAIGVTNFNNYTENDNLYPYKTILYPYDKITKLNEFEIEYSLCLIADEYACLDNPNELLALLKDIKSYDFYKNSENIYIDAEMPEELRDNYVLNNIPSDNRYKNSLDIYEALKELIEDDDKKLGVIRSQTTQNEYEKATRNVPFSDLNLDSDMYAIMLYRTYDFKYQRKNVDSWMYQSVKKENPEYGIFIGDFKEKYTKNDLKEDLTICSALGRKKVFIYDYKGFSKKCALDDLKPLKQITIEISKTDELAYFYSFLGLEFLNILLFFYFNRLIFIVSSIILITFCFLFFFAFIERDSRTISKKKANNKTSIL